MRVSIFVFLMTIFLIPIVNSAQINTLSYVTEQYPPYNYTQNNITKGIAIDILVEASSQIQSPIDINNIKVQPWATAYRSALITPDTVLFSTTRTQLREHIFQWAGPISQTKIVVLGRKDRNFTINGPLTLAQYRIGVIRDDVGEQLLVELGVPRESMIESTVPQKLVHQFISGELDLWAYEENVAKWWLKESGQSPDDYESVFTLSEGDLYFAFNLGTDRALVRKLQEGINQLKLKIDDNGKSRYQVILDKYR